MTRPRIAESDDERSVDAERADPPVPEQLPLLALQRSAGNQAVGRYLQRTRSERGERSRGEKGRAQQRRRDRDEKPDRDGRPPEGEPEGFLEDGDEEQTDYDVAYTQALNKFSGLAGQANRLGFSRTGDPPRFDDRFWKCTLVVRSDTQPRLRRVDYNGDPEQFHTLLDDAEEIDFEYTLNDDAMPHEAVDALYSGSRRWSLDCIDFVVAARLYAECKAKGDFQFDLKYRDLGRHIKRGPLKMAQHETTGLTGKGLWLRPRQGAEFRVQAGGVSTTHAPQNFAEEDLLLARVPIGARVMWTSSFEEGNPDMENENTIKVGPDLYAAHPLGTVSARTIRKQLVVDEVGPEGQERELTREEQRQQMIDHIYLAEIEFYDRK